MTRPDVQRPPIRWTIAGLVVLSAAFLRQARAEDPLRVPQEVSALIQQAGDADDDTARLAILKRIRALPDLGRTLRDDVDKMIAVLDCWVQAKDLSFFERTLYKKGDYDFGVSEKSSFYPLTALYRGRMLVWVIIESRGWGRPGGARSYLDRARGLFEQYSKAFPKNRIARMYLGQPIPPDKIYSASAGAPHWAVQQREALERLTDILEWWVDHRMQPNGEYGGGWGDDCEMWRCWVPILIGFDTPKITGAQARFSQAMMNQPHMAKGYTSHMTDVEHSAEDSADVITPMMHLDPDNPVWKQRALRLADLMENLWTGRNERGFLQFKSTYFNVERVSDRAQQACDTVYHPRAVQPTLLYWQRTGDERLTRLFSEWMDTWVDATARTERGKPAGILPVAIHWPEGHAGGLGPDWWDPKNHSETTLYLWPSSMSMMVHTLLLTHRMTGQTKYLEPIRSMARIRLKYLRAPMENPAAGTEAWCASRMGFLADALAKYRFLTGSGEFDELLSQDMPPYMRFRTGGNRDKLSKALQEDAESLRVNFAGFTDEVRYTDRLLRFPSIFSKDGLLPEPVSTLHVPETNLLYSAVTGDPGTAYYFPLNAVRWRTPSRNIATLVTDSGKDRLAAELFHFGKDTRSMLADLFLLDPAEYTLMLSAADTPSNPLTTQKVLVRGPRTRIRFELPPERRCLLRVARR